MLNSEGAAGLEKATASEDVSKLSIVALASALCLVVVLVIGSSILVVDQFESSSKTNEWEKNGAVQPAYQGESVARGTPGASFER